MTKDRRYRNPPVVEALCEIYLKESAWDDTVPGQFYDRVKDRFPVKRQREIQEAKFSLSTAGEAAAGIRRLPPWIQFVTESGDRMIQLARDLLVVNQLRPYPHFDDWEPAIYSALEVYRELAMPKAVARLGVRYINRVAIPEPRIRMEEYFTLYPQLPQAMGDERGGFLLRVEVPAMAGENTVFLTFASAPADNPGETAFLLDLYNVFQPSEPLALETLQCPVKTAHENIITAFEGSITDRLRTLFKPEEGA